MSSLSQLYAEINRVTFEVEQWLKLHDGEQARLLLKPIEKAQLLKLSVWAKRNRIDLQDVLNILVPILRKMVTPTNGKPRKVRSGLGVGIKFLTGPLASRMLSNQIAKQYPSGEQKNAWREREREAQLFAEAEEALEGLHVREVKPLSMLEASSVEDYVERYRTAVFKKRTAMQRAMNQRWRRRKNYVNNPWR